MNCVELLLGLGIEVDVRGAVDALGDRLDLVLDRLVVLVERLERRSAARTPRPPPRRGRPRRSPPLAKPSLASAPNAPASSASRLTSSTSSSVSPGRRLTATTPAARTRGRSRGGGARWPCPPRSPRSAVRAVDARVVLDAAVVLDRAHRGDEHDRARRQPAEAADDVEELLHPHVGAEARLGDHVVAELHPDQVGDQRVVAVRDVRERAAVHQARLALERLDQVRLDRVLEQHGHRAGRAEVLGGHRLAAVERVRRR